MTVLVVGGNGFVGSHVVDALLGAGHAVRVMSPHPELFRPPLDGVDYRFGRLEIGANLDAALDGVDAVVDAVSTAVPASAAESPATTIAAAVGSATWLGESCLRSEVGTLVYLSSGGTVYGRGESEILHGERQALTPISTYGAAKAASELSLGALLGGSRIRYTSLRIANAYGERQNPERPQGIVAVALSRMRDGRELTLFGDTMRDYVHVTDVASSVRHAIETPMAGPYNIGSGTAVATSDILARLVQVSGFDLSYRREQLRHFDVPFSAVDITRARGAGWRPVVGLDEGLARTWDWFRQSFAELSQSAVR